MKNVRRKAKRILSLLLVLVLSVSLISEQAQITTAANTSLFENTFHWKVVFVTPEKNTTFGIDSSNTLEHDTATVYIKSISGNTASFRLPANTLDHPERSFEYSGTITGIPYYAQLSNIVSKNSFLTAHIHVELLYSVNGKDWVWLCGNQQNNYNDYQSISNLSGRMKDIKSETYESVAQKYSKEKVWSFTMKDICNVYYVQSEGFDPNYAWKMYSILHQSFLRFAANSLVTAGSTNGLCHGFAVSAAASNYYEELSEFSQTPFYEITSDAASLSLKQKYRFDGSNFWLLFDDFSVYDYLCYSHLTQNLFDSGIDQHLHMIKKEHKSSNEIGKYNNLVHAVENYEHHNALPVIISLDGYHSLYALRMIDDLRILVYDGGTPQKQIFNLKKDANGNYCGWSYAPYGKDETNIDLTYDTQSVPGLLSFLCEKHGLRTRLLYNESKSKSVKVKQSSEETDTDYHEVLVASTKGGELSTPNDTLIPWKGIESDMDLAWFYNSDTDEITYTAKEDDASFIVGGDNRLTNVDLGNNNTVTLENYETEDWTIEIEAQAGDSPSIEIDTYTDDEFSNKIKVAGIVQDESVEVHPTDSGLSVVGLNSLNVQFENANGESTEAVLNVNDGREVNITLNEATGNIQTDFTETTDSPSVPDAQNEGGCPLCGKSHAGNAGVKAIHYVMYYLTWLFRDWLPGLLKK